MPLSKLAKISVKAIREHLGDFHASENAIRLDGMSNDEILRWMNILDNLILKSIARELGVQYDNLVITIETVRAIYIKQ